MTETGANDIGPQLLPEKEDYGWILESMAIAYADSDATWDEDTVEMRIRNERGTVAFNRENRIFATASARERPAIYKGVIPAGLSTQVKDLVPQRHNQKHLDEKICPVLADLLRGVAADVPAALDYPVFAFIAADLALYWANSPVQTEVEIGFQGVRALVYVSTLKLAIQRLEAAGL